MFFKKAVFTPYITLFFDGSRLYSGPLCELPIREDVLLQKSEYFFNDPEPCHIHRNAVRIRLTEEIRRECSMDAAPCPPGPCLLSYADFMHIDSYLLTEQKINHKS